MTVVERVYRTRRVKTGASPTKERKTKFGGVVHEPVEWDQDGRTLITRYRAAWVTPLCAYRQHHFLSDVEYEAGMTFNMAFYRSVRSRAAKARRLNPRPLNENLTTSERIVRDALRVIPAVAKKAVVDVCGYEEPADNVRKLAELKIGLSHLAKAWRLASSEVGTMRSTTVPKT